MSTLIYAFIGLSIIFVTIGFLVTEQNAKYLLAGYNTMRQAEQEAFDLPGYLTLFRRFHLFLGASLLLGGLLIAYLISPWATQFFLIGYPIFAYLLFGWYGDRHYANKHNAVATRRPE